MGLAFKPSSPRLRTASRHRFTSSADTPEASPPGTSQSPVHHRHAQPPSASSSSADPFGRMTVSSSGKARGWHHIIIPYAEVNKTCMFPAGLESVLRFARWRHRAARRTNRTCRRRREGRPRQARRVVGPTVGHPAEPAETHEVLPAHVGFGRVPPRNGRLGCTVYGGIAEEHTQFNEDTLWTGDEDDTGRFQNFGEMFVALEGHADASPAGGKYRRELDIEKALHTITYEVADVHYRREYFASHPANVLVFRFTADRKGAYTGTVRLKDAHAGETKAAAHDRHLRQARRNIGLAYEAQAMI